jgi:hypothetical protein
MKVSIPGYEMPPLTAADAPKGKKAKKAAKKEAKRVALANRVAAATNVKDIKSATLDQLLPQVTTDELVFDGKKGPQFTTAARFMELANSPQRLQERYNEALWADSTGNPDSRFGQFEERLLAEGKPSPAARGLDRVIAAQRAGQATNISEGIAQRQIRATGIRPDSDEAASMKRQFGIARVLNRVDAQNAADKAMDARRDLVRDYSFDAEGNAQNAIGGAIGSAAASDLDRKLRKRGQNASDDAGVAGMVGQGVGLALSAFALSHSSLKEEVTAVGDGEILEGLRQLEINRWKYRGEDTVHVGPMAEDFHRIFGVGDGVTLQLVDVMGVALGALKELAHAADRK